jgi:hypothetical protein
MMLDKSGDGSLESLVAQLHKRMSPVREVQSVIQIQFDRRSAESLDMNQIGVSSHCRTSIKLRTQCISPELLEQQSLIESLIDAPCSNRHNMTQSA